MSNVKNDTSTSISALEVINTINQKHWSRAKTQAGTFPKPHPNLREQIEDEVRRMYDADLDIKSEDITGCKIF